MPSHITVDEKALKNKKTKSATASAAFDEPKLRAPAPGPRPNTNPNLDSFEAVMQAMEEELARARASKTSFKPPDISANSSASAKGKEIASEDMDIEKDMDAELRAALEEDDEDDMDEDGFPLGEGDGLDYNLIKNFLESFKSQGGLAGPVSNLAGRLQPGWNLPRDAS